MRIAALLAPDFPLQALRRSSPELAEAPVAATAGPAPRDAVVAVSAEAAELGVRAGMTMAQARSIAPAVLLRTTPPEAAEAAAEALADASSSFSPRIKRHVPGEIVLDVGGLLPRFGREEAIAHELWRACRRVGLDGRVGIASSVGVARVAARCNAHREPLNLCTSELSNVFSQDKTLAIVPTGDEAKFLAPLPLAWLEPSPPLAEMLARWGLRTAGELARLPRDEVALRLGQEGLALHRLACGEETGAFIPDPVRENVREGITLEHAIVALEVFLFVLNGLLSRLSARLELRGEGFSALLLDLHLAGGERREYHVKLIAPTREVTAVLAMTRMRLEAHPPGGPVEAITAQVTPGRVRLTQGALFGAPLPAPGKLAMTLARLQALLGPERVGAPALPDTHHPAAWSMTAFSPAPLQAAASRSPEPGARSPLLSSRSPVLRVLRPPREAHVVAVGGRPVAARVGGTGGVVVACAGPYRFVGDWWGDQPFARDDFDVATSDGSLLRVFFDHLERKWFTDGFYD